jgi:hypothetical protein
MRAAEHEMPATIVKKTGGESRLQSDPRAPPSRLPADKARNQAAIDVAVRCVREDPAEDVPYGEFLTPRLSKFSRSRDAFVPAAHDRYNMRPQEHS